MTAARTVDHAHSADLDAWTCAFDPDEPGGWGPHRHDQHQLVWTAAGSALVVAADRSWLLPPSRALWLPGGVVHDVELRVPAALHCLYVWPRACPLDWAAPTLVAVTPLLRELLVSLGAGGGVGAVAAPARTLVFHELAHAVLPDDGLVLPQDERAAVVAARIVERPDDETPLADWAARLHVGESTLRRAFVVDTGLSFTEWRTRARLQAALPLLERGLPVTAVAGRVGYASVNGFGTAFRRRYGTSPGSRSGVRPASGAGG